MASGSVNTVTAVITGGTLTATTDVGSSQTITIGFNSNADALDLSRLIIRGENTNTITSVTFTIGAGTRYSAVGQGASAAITLATATTSGYTKIIGGHDFESARFQITAGTIVLTVTGTGPTSWEAYQCPFAAET